MKCLLSGYTCSSLVIASAYKILANDDFRPSNSGVSSPIGNGDSQHSPAVDTDGRACLQDGDEGGQPHGYRGPHEIGGGSGHGTSR